MKFGTKVRTLTAIMTDDRENGLDDEYPVYPKGTIGTVVHKSHRHDGSGVLKVPEAWYVDFGDYGYDLTPDEFELV